jgi:hypothetical protein
MPVLKRILMNFIKPSIELASDSDNFEVNKNRLKNSFCVNQTTIMNFDEMCYDEEGTNCLTQGEGP